ncbi:MAG: TonB-dependent receptor [Acidobacteria bacterium]|nr:MAG: TonB-dependent receptor [Acidobacteriota bacterium]
MRSTATVILLAAGLAGLLGPAQASAQGGTIEGTVIFTGQPRRNPLIQMGADPNCLQINAGKRTVQELVKLSPDKAIGNVFVHLLGDVPYDGGPPAEPVVIEQRGCIYHPRIAGAVSGQVLKVINADSTLHNIHTQSEAGNSFNIGQPMAGMEYEHVLRGEEVMLRLKCDVHPWMTGYLGVKKNPYFAVTGDDGSFRIEGVPAGTYTLQAWQEVLKTRDLEVEVKDGETTTVEIAFGPPPARETSALNLPLRDLLIPALAHAHAAER